MATFVLVHGAWAGGWIRKKIIPLLRAAGHDVHATTATSLGDRVHLADQARARSSSGGWWLEPEVSVRLGLSSLARSQGVRLRHWRTATAPR